MKQRTTLLAALALLCAGCGDDFGTLVCRHCGATMPGVCLSDLPKRTDSEKPEPVKEAG
jgi:hypothetical protein